MKKILKFSASWCGPCKTVSQTLKDEAFNDVVVEEIDLENDDNADLIIEHAIKSIPTMVYFVDGVQVGKTVGNISKEKILEQFN